MLYDDAIPTTGGPRHVGQYESLQPGMGLCLSRVPRGKLPFPVSTLVRAFPIGPDESSHASPSLYFYDAQLLLADDIFHFLPVGFLGKK
jgi:hypothetical protein